MIQNKISRLNLSKYIRQILIAYLLIFSIFFSCIVSSNSLSESEDKNIVNSSKTNFLGNGVFEIVNEERSNLTKIGQWDENYGIPDDFYIEEDKLYTNNGQEGLLVFDIIDKANPKLLRTINFTDYCIDLIIKDNHAFIVLQTGSLEVLDLTV
ncbi:MAG: hypothetical protein ACTSSH_09245, partial [Candidatus Heimdallarchaeota archaeon]